MRPFTSSTRRGLQAAIETESLTEPEDEREVPTWIRRVLEHGLSADPSKRWRSVAALLEALDQGRRLADRRRLRVGLAIGGTLIIGGVGLWAGLDARERARCRALADEIDVLWNDEVRANATRAMTDVLPSYGPQAMRSVARDLDRWTEGWREARFATCWSLEETLRARADLCLTEQRTVVALFTEKLQETDKMFAYSAVITASTLKNPDPCADPNDLRQQPEVHADSTELMGELYRALAEASAANWEADHETAIATMRAALDKAEDLEHLPIRARLHGVLGGALASSSKYEDALAELREAYRLAARADDLALTAMFADRLATLLGDELRKTEQARIWLEVAEVAWARQGDDSSLDYADHIATIALVETAAENYDEGLAAFKALRRLRTNHLGLDHPNAALAAAMGEGHPILATTTNTLAIALLDLGRTDEAVQAARRALEIAEIVHEAGHSEIAMCRTTLGYALHENGEHAEAREASLKALAEFEGALGKRHPHVGAVNVNVGEMYFQQDELDPARRYFELGLEIARAHEDADDAAVIEFRLAQIVAAEGKTQQARTDLTAALAALLATGSEEAAAEAQVALANLELDDGRPDAAMEPARTAWTSSDATNEDRLAAALAFARALSEGSKPDRERALRVAREALGRSTELPELVELVEFGRLQRWLAEQDP